MSSLNQILAAAKTTLDAIEGLNVYDHVADAVNLPAVIPMPSEANFVAAMGRGLDTWQIDLYVMCANAVAEIGQDALNDFITGAGDNSIREHIWNNRDLGLDDVDAHVSGMGDYNAQFTITDIPHVGAVLHMTVHTKGTA